MSSFFDRFKRQFRKRPPDIPPEGLSFNAKVLELILAVGVSKKEDEARARIRDRQMLFKDRAFYGALTQIRQVDTTSSESLPSLDPYIALITDELINITLALQSTELGYTQLCLIILLAEYHDRTDQITHHFQSLLEHGDAIAAEMDLIAQELEARNLPEDAKRVRDTCNRLTRVQLAGQIMDARSAEELYKITQDHYGEMDLIFFMMIGLSITGLIEEDTSSAETLRQKFHIVRKLATHFQANELGKRVIGSNDLAEALDLIYFTSETYVDEGFLETLDESFSDPASVASTLEMAPYVLDVLELLRLSHRMQTGGINRPDALSELHAAAGPLKEYFTLLFGNQIGLQKTQLAASFLNTMRVDNLCELFWDNLEQFDSEFMQFLDSMIEAGRANVPELQSYSMRRKEGLERALEIVKSGGARSQAEVVLRQYMVLELVLNRRLGQKHYFEQAAIFDDTFLNLLRSEIDRARNSNDSEVAEHLELYLKMAVGLQQALRDGQTVSQLVEQADAGRTFTHCNLLFTQLMSDVPDKLKPIPILKVFMGATLMTSEEDGIEWIEQNQTTWNYITQASSGDKPKLEAARDHLTDCLTKSDLTAKDQGLLRAYSALIRLALNELHPCFDDLMNMLVAAARDGGNHLLQASALAFIVMTYTSHLQSSIGLGHTVVVGNLTRTFEFIATEIEDPAAKAVAEISMPTIQIINSITFFARQLYGGQMPEYYREIERALQIAQNMQTFTGDSWPLREWVERMISPE